MIFQNQGGILAVVGVALVIAVGKPCPDFSQIARPDWLTAQYTERRWAGRSAVHQDESHGVVPRMLRTVMHVHLLSALRGVWLVRLILSVTPIFGRRKSGEFAKCPRK